MKRLIAVTLSGMVLAGALAACTGGGTSEVASTSEKASNSQGQASSGTGGGGKYALVMSHMTNAFTTTFASSAEQAAKELKLELTVFDGEQDSATQISQIESAITQGYVGIMVEPVSVDGIKPAVEAANQANIPIITVIQMMTEQDLAKSYVGGDDKQAGILQMEKAIEEMGGKGNIAILYGPMGSDGQLIRKEGYDEVLAKHPDVKVVFEQTANWVTDEALKITENWLQSGTEIQAVVAQNDGMAIGAMKAVEDAKLSESIKIYGVDATPDGVAAIAAGRMAGTVSQDVAGMGRLAVETIAQIVEGKTVEPVIRTVPVWVNKENVADFE